MSTQIVPLEQMNTMAQAISASGLFNLKTPEQVLALMIVAQSEGRHPGAVARDYHIINGTPCLKADTILARFQEAGGRVEWHELNDKIADASFTHPAGGTVRIDWTRERAKQAQLNSPMWNKYPRAMLRARCISEGVRTIFPVVLGGLYANEEVEDFDEVKPPREKDVTPPKQEAIKPAKAKPELATCLEYIHAAKDATELEKYVYRASQYYPSAGDTKLILEARSMRMEELGIPTDTVSGASPKPEKAVEQEGIGKELLQTILNGINGADTLDRLESDYSAGMDVCRSAKDRASAATLQRAYKERLKVIENQQVIEGEVVV